MRSGSGSVIPVALAEIEGFDVLRESFPDDFVGQAIVFGAIGMSAVTTRWVLRAVTLDPVRGSIIEKTTELLMDALDGFGGIVLERREVDIVKAGRVVMLTDLHAAFEDPGPHFELPTADFVRVDPVAVEAAKSVDEAA